MIDQNAAENENVERLPQKIEFFCYRKLWVLTQTCQRFRFGGILPHFRVFPAIPGGIMEIPLFP